METALIGAVAIVVETVYMKTVYNECFAKVSVAIIKYLKLLVCMIPVVMVTIKEEWLLWYRLL